LIDSLIDTYIYLLTVLYLYRLYHFYKA